MINQTLKIGQPLNMKQTPITTQYIQAMSMSNMPIHGMLKATIFTVLVHAETSGINHLSA
jgi:hypothetical protein